MPRFSIIIGVYNQAATLPILIQSLMAQSFQDFEVHFCDDGSTDDSRRIIESAMVQRLFYHRQDHKGMRLAKNINQGIRAAKGEYCLFLMADSFIEDDYLATLNEWAQPFRMVCGIRIQLDTVNGKLEGVDIDWRVKKKVIPDFASAIIGQPWGCLTGNGLTIPTEALHTYGGWDEELEGYGGEDNEIVGRLFFKGYIAYSVPDLRLYHHWHQSKEMNETNVPLVQRKLTAYLYDD